jgi:hypothetical protein
MHYPCAQGRQHQQNPRKLRNGLERADLSVERRPPCAAEHPEAVPTNQMLCGRRCGIDAPRKSLRALRALRVLRSKMPLGSALNRGGRGGTWRTAQISVQRELHALGSIPRPFQTIHCLNGRGAGLGAWSPAERWDDPPFPFQSVVSVHSVSRNGAPNDAWARQSRSACSGPTAARR